MKTLIFALSLGLIAPCTAPAAPAFKRLQLSEKFYAEGAAAGDFNKDGKADVISGPWWYAGPEFTERSAVYDTKDFNPKGYAPNFNTWAHDFNGDGWDDVIRVSHPGAQVFWHENPGGDGKGEWKQHVALDSLENESPQFGDINGDGQPDLTGSVAGQFAYFTYNKAKPTEKWTRHNISPGKVTGGKYTHGLGLGDVDGDGKMDLLDKDHWWQQPASLDGDPEWKGYRFQFSGPGGADMFAYDFDGDGDNDIYTAAAAHSYGLTWFEQAEAEGGKKIWKRHVITGAKPEDSESGVVFSQAHSAQLVDMDGDGVKDLVTGKRWWAHNGNDPGGNDPAVLYWFKVVRGGKSGEAKFIPHKIDNDSGVGTQFVVEDIDGDKKPDIIVGNKKGTFLHLQIASDKAAGAGPIGLLRDGDRVVLLGNTFIEREGAYGCIETQLALGASVAGHKVTFRNLGWSGDTVLGHARSYFGPPQEGFDRLKKHVELIKPTLIIANYGAVAAFEGEKGVQGFVDGYRRLIGMLRASSGGARIALMSPPPCETLGPPLPDMGPQNERLAGYRDAIRKLALQEKCGFLDLFEAMSGAKSAEFTLTDNGIHFTGDGYRHVALKAAPLFGYQPVKATPDNAEALEHLRMGIVKKNTLFFHRWRPANETYLHGFRKHEQGNNAAEIPQFDALVEAEEAINAEAVAQFIKYYKLK